MNIQIVTNFIQQQLRRNWPARGGVSPEKTAIVFANYNTIKLTSYLLFSIFRILGTDALSHIVAVDNNSTDGSRELLQSFADMGMIDLICNQKQSYHGPAINQAIKYLAAKERRRHQEKNTRFIWILDSDVIILKNNALTDAVNFIKYHEAAAVGQFQYDALPEGYAHISSLLIDPIKVWNRKIFPFDNTGAPAVNLQQSLRAHGLKIGNFPYRSRHYLLHLARGTLKSIYKRQDCSNIYYQWSTNHSEHHYHGTPGGHLIHERFLEVFNREVPELTPAGLLAACRRPGLVEIHLPSEFEFNQAPAP